MLSFVNKRAILRQIELLGVLMFFPTALRSVESATNPPPTSVQVPFELRQGSPVAQVRVNGSTPLWFKLDTGFGVTTIHPDLIETLQLKRAGTMTIIGIAGEEKADTFGSANFNFNGMTYSPRRIAAIPSDAQRRRRNQDGILGVGFFRRFVVEINSTQHTLTLHDPKQFDYTGKGEIIPLEFRKDTPIVEAAINFTNREPVRAKFEIDTGCDGELCLGHDFVEANKLDGDADSGRTGSRFGVGGSVDTRHGVLPQFQLGKLTINELPANFFMEGSPVGDGLAGHIGMGTLRRFHVILDYSRKRMILEPTR